jgi:hypothetical protein
MNSVILCEGSDDMWFLGYLLHKWSSNPKTRYSTSQSTAVDKLRELELSTLSWIISVSVGVVKERRH